MSSSCYDVQEMLRICIKDSECMKREGDFHVCLKSKELDEECALMRKAYYECKRGQLDMRNRLRGNPQFNPR